MLGRLARYLRFFGFDTEYVRDSDDEAIARRAIADGRTLVTRDRDLARRTPDSLLVHSPEIGAQIREVRASVPGLEFTLVFDRCPECNALLRRWEPPMMGSWPEQLPVERVQGGLPVYECPGLFEVLLGGDPRDAHPGASSRLALGGTHRVTDWLVELSAENLDLALEELHGAVEALGGRLGSAADSGSRWVRAELEDAEGAVRPRRTAGPLTSDHPSVAEGIRRGYAGPAGAGGVLGTTGRVIPPGRASDLDGRARDRWARGSGRGSRGEDTST